MLRGIRNVVLRFVRGLGSRSRRLALRLVKLSALAVTVASLLVVLDALFFPEEDRG